MSEQEYIVSLNQGVDYLAFDAEMVNLTGAGCIPNRAVAIANARPGSQRNTHYFLTIEEVKILQADTRVLAVELRPEDRDDVEIGIVATQDADFTKSTASTGVFVNWGLRRMIGATNPYVGTQVSGGYTHTLSGAGVDMIIQDTGIQADHPEFLDSANTNRVQQIDWYGSQSVVSGTMPANHYTDIGGHGTHCAGISAGLTYGWAKNARIYSMKIAGLGNPGIPVSDCFDLIKEWHKAKPIDPATGVKRPTVVNMSWGYSGSFFGITGGNYRGTTWAGNNRRTDYGMTGSFNGFYYTYPVRIASVDVDMDELIAAGVHVCVAAGNGYTKVDTATGLDYNNYYTNVYGNNYYHRGMSPYSTNALIVGNVDSSYTSLGSEKSAWSSNRGPGVDVFAPGTRIFSSLSTTTVHGGGDYPQNTNFKAGPLSGTSMASPNVAGLLSTYLEINPAATPAEAKLWVTSNAKTGLLYDPIDDLTTYTSQYSLFGGPNLYAFQPFNVPEVLNIAGTVTSESTEAVVVPTYTLSSSASGVDEGGSFTITLATTNLVNSTIIPYTITGVSSSDINNAALTGSFVIGVTNTVTFEVSADSIFDDGTETFLLSLDNNEATVSVTIADTSSPNPTYFLGSSSSTAEEGSTIVITLTTGNVPSGTTLGYTITGITSADISGESLTGQFVVGTTNTKSFTFTADETSEGQESMVLALTNGLATTTIVIADTSVVAPTYTLTSNVASVNEGGTFIVTLTYLNGVPGVVVPWTITGVAAADVVGGTLTGSFVIGTTETATVQIVNDTTTEGAETIQFTLNNDSTNYVTVLVNDTSLDIVDGTQAFTTSGSGLWTVPSGVTNIGFMAIGGGGAGPAASIGHYSSGGGGGAIGFKNNITVTPGQTISFSIGAGGSGASGNGGNTSISIGGATYTAGGGTAGSSAAMSSGTLLAGGAGGGATGAWDGSHSGGPGGDTFRLAGSSTGAVSGGGGGAGGMGGTGGSGSPQTILWAGTAQNPPAETIVDGVIGSGSGGGHSYVADWNSGTGAVTGGRGGGVAVVLGRSGLGGLKPTTNISRSILGAGVAKDGSIGGVGNIVGTSLSAGAGGGGIVTMALSSTSTQASAGISGAIMFTYPGNIDAYKFLAPTYALTANKTSVYEGASFVVTLATNLTLSATPVPFTITGVSSPDINNDVLTGNLTPAANTKTITVTADAAIEGSETFTMALDNGAASDSVTIVDSSTGTEQQYTANVTAPSSGAYAFASATDRNGAYTGNNPYIVANVNDTLAFSVNASGHPFYIKTQTGSGTANQVDGVTNQGTQTGTLTYLPRTSGKTYYQCSSHAAMNGTIYTTGDYWVSSTEYTNSAEEVLKVVGDNLGNTVAISKATSASNVYTYFVYQLNSKGDLVWRKAIASPNFLRGLCIDSSNNIYIVGGADHNMLDSQVGSVTKCKALTMKINSAGTIQWSKKYSSWSGGQAHFNDCCIGQDGVTLNCIGELHTGGDPSVDMVGNNAQYGTGILWHRVTLTNGQAAVSNSISGVTYTWPAVSPQLQADIRFRHICYEALVDGATTTHRYYVAGVHAGREPSTTYNGGTASVQQKDRIVLRMYEEGGNNIPTIEREVTFENKDASTDITIGGLDVSQDGVAITINDASSGKGEVYILANDCSSVLHRIGLYDSSGTTERNVLTDVKIDGTIVYVVGQQKEDSAKNFTPYVGALNGFYSKINIASLATADSRILLSTGNTSINTCWLDESVSAPTKLLIGGQGNASSKLPAGNAAQYVATLPIGSQDHYGEGVGNVSSTVSQTYEDWAIAKTGYVEARTAVNSNFTATIYSAWNGLNKQENRLLGQHTAGMSSVPAYILGDNVFVTTHLMTEATGPVPTTPSATTEYKMPLSPYATASGGTATYALTPSASVTNEDTVVTITLSTSNVADTTTVAYTISGVESADINGASLTGNFTIASNTATLPITISADATTEGEETLTIALDGLGINTTVTINDSSTVAVGSQLITTSGTWTVPSGVTSINAVAIGGGGGTNPGIGSGGSAAGGGGGALAWINEVSVNPGDVITITVGNAGSAGTASPSSYSVSDYSSSANLSWTPSYNIGGAGSASIVTLANSDVLINAGGGKPSTQNSLGGTFTTNSSYGSTRGGTIGLTGVAVSSANGVSNNIPGGGGGAGGWNYEDYTGGGGNGGSGRGQFYRSNGGYDYSKAIAGARGGGTEPYGKYGPAAATGTSSPNLINSTSPLSINYTGAVQGGTGSAAGSGTTSYGGGGGGGVGGRIRYQNISNYYYKMFLAGPSSAAQGGCVRITWGGSTFP